MSGHQNIWAKSTKLVEAPHFDKKFLDVLAKYNITQYNHVAVSAKIGPRHVQQTADRDTW